MLDNDEVKCWGDNQYGQLGDGTTTDKTSPPSSAITFPTGLTPVALVAGDEQACAIMDDESLTCWGRNEHGELGHGGATDRTSPTAVSLNAGENVIDVGSGDVHACALLDDGSIKCWGRNTKGQLGDGTNNDRSLPTSTASLGAGRTAVDIGVGEVSVCALLDNDDVKCWGWNHKGQLGDGTNTTKNSPPSSAITFPTGRTPVAFPTLVQASIAPAPSLTTAPCLVGAGMTTGNSVMAQPPTVTRQSSQTPWAQDERPCM